MTPLVLVSVGGGSLGSGWVGHRRNWADAPSYYHGGGHSGSSARESGPIATADRLVQTDG